MYEVLKIKYVPDVWLAVFFISSCISYRCFLLSIANTDVLDWKDGEVLGPSRIMWVHFSTRYILYTASIFFTLRQTFTRHFGDLFKPNQSEWRYDLGCSDLLKLDLQLCMKGLCCFAPQTSSSYSQTTWALQPLCLVSRSSLCLLYKTQIQMDVAESEVGSSSSTRGVEGGFSLFFSFS